MKLVILLHFYQPFNQQPDILNRIVNECYIPLTRGLLSDTRFKVNINFNGSLVDLLSIPSHTESHSGKLDTSNYAEVLSNLKKLHDRGQVELTGSAKYHPFMPLISEDENERQIELNNDSMKGFLGNDFVPEGFFPPEMAVSESVVNTAYKKHFKWVACPEFAYKGQLADTTKLYTDKATGIKLLFRNKRVSSLLLSSVCRDVDDFVSETKDLWDCDNYWFCVMDAETFGHHRIGHEKFLMEVLADSRFEPMLVSDLLKDKLPEEQVTVRPSTWSNEEQDYWLDKEKTIQTEAKSFVLWQDPENPIHAMQWELTNLVITALEDYKDKDAEPYKKARITLDKVLSSDQYWWASAKPWWSLEMIEQGAYEMKSVLLLLAPHKEHPELRRAEDLYRRILDKAFEWQRTGYIRERHLNNSGTYLREPFKQRCPVEWYNQMMLEFEEEMNKSAERRDYEKAVKWRDALIKIEQGTDIYDVMHAVDELWSAKRLPSVRAFLSHNWEEFSEFSKKYFIDKDRKPLTKEIFDEWKTAVKA